MPFIENEKEKIYYQDYGQGQPVILIHGWPLSHKSWEKQTAFLVENGYRVIAYDRRGFGNSSQPWEAYDYSTLASDLKQLLVELDLNDAVIVGFSMGGGEVVRYFTDYGNDRVSKAALISSIIPLVKQKEDNPEGVPEDDLNGIMQALKDDRVGFLKDFGKNFYNYEDLKDRLSDAQLHYDWSIASHASPRATIKCAESWAETDFREEMKNVNVPTLIVHGDADQVVPIETAGKQAAKGIKNNTFKIIEGAPHGLNVTHASRLNQILLEFLQS